MGLGWTDRLERLADRWALPAKSVPGLPVLTVTGRGTAVIENSGALLEYTPERVSVFAGGLVVRLVGRDLTLKALNPQGLAVTGVLSGVEYVPAPGEGT